MHRTQAAQYVFEDVVGGVVHLGSVSGLSRYVVGDMDQDDVIILAVVEGLDDLIVELFDQGVVF